MNIRELYERGHQRFRFSDGKVREPVVDMDKGNGVPFEVPNSKSGVVGTIFYLPDGTPNVRADRFPAVIGVAEDESMNKRDEIRKAIENGVSDAVVCMDDEDEAELVNCVMRSLTELVERWTDEETAEDVGKGCQVREGEEYVGMRFRVNGWHEDNSPEFAGATGTVVKDDRDGAPGVHFDAPWDAHNDLKDNPYVEGSYTYFSVDRMEKVEE